MTWSRVSRATTVLGGCLSQLRSELIELLSSSWDIRKGNTCDCCGLPHQASQQVGKQMHQISFCTISGFGKIISIFKVVLDEIPLRCLPAQLIEWAV